MRLKVADVKYHQDAVKQVKVGDTIELIPQPHCPYDAHAIRIFHESRLLGYVPRVLTSTVSRIGVNMGVVVGMDKPVGVDIVGVTISVGEDIAPIQEFMDVTTWGHIR
jgi:hypothetical protein